MTAPVRDLDTTGEDALFRRIAAFAQREAGLSIPDTKRSLAVSRLTRRLAATGIATLPAYLDFLESPAGGEERQRAVSALTTNVTSFFRERHHFETLNRELLQGLAAPGGRGRRIRIWSAGCSSGEEPYSIAITVLEAIPDAGDRDIRILATDIDTAMIALARAGRYDAAKLDGLSPEQRSRHFRPSGDPRAFEVADPLRRLVSVRPLNLIAPWPMRGQFDAIFCRNVVIYFDAATQRALWPRFEAALAPGGHLFLGHSERLAGGADSRLTAAGVTTYRKPATQPAGGPARGN